MLYLFDFEWLRFMTIRSRIFFTWAAFRWLLLMFLVAPAVEAPLVAHPNVPVKPLRVWTGLVSWYGPRFEGRRTASGEVFDSSANTVAHPTLPFGTLLRVVNQRTGKGQLVRVNDRGPFVEGRELDVSQAVARRLGIEERGIARLKIEMLEVPRRRMVSQ